LGEDALYYTCQPKSRDFYEKVKDIRCIGLTSDLITFGYTPLDIKDLDQCSDK
jgi:hypothetical protein